MSGIDSIRNTSKAVHSNLMTDGLAEFPQGQAQGIYVGVVKQIVYSSRNGHLKVYIPDFGGNEDDDTSWKDVIYASPYMGRTKGQHPSSVEAVNEDNTFFKGRQSYGMYMVPPDLDNEVLCFFSPNRFEGYWFACINSDRTRQMTPGIGSVKIDSVDPASIPDYLRPYLNTSWNFPVAETVINLSSSESETDPALILKPIHEPLTLQYFIQGLISDNARGPITSSSQRDPTSSVFGFSTPGRPIATQDPALNQELRNQIKSGTVNPADLAVTNRYQGHSFIMDDGDFNNDNNLVRLRTSAGHQILMNDSEGFIYVSNSAGTGWVELTAGGDVLVYGANDLAIRMQGNIMMRSDRNISFEAQGDIALKAGASIKNEAQVIQARAETGLNLFGKVAQLRGASQTAILSGGPMMIKASGAIMVNGSKIALNGQGGGGEVSPPQPLKQYYRPDARINDIVWYTEPNALTSINTKVPTHEPYIRGDLAEEIAEQTSILEAFTTDVNGNAIAPPTNVNDIGPSQSENIILTQSAPTDAFISQLDAPNQIGILNQTDLTALNAQIGYNLSSGNYTYVNDQGQVGKYALNASDLIDSGYLKEGTDNTLAAIQNPNNWRGNNGINDLDSFLAAPVVQERVQYDKTRNVYAQLESEGLITAKTTNQEAAGLVSAAIKTSPQEVYNWYTTGSLPSDSGTDLVQYYKRGIYSQTQTPTIIASKQSRT